MDKSKCFRSYLPISEVLVTDLAGDGRGHGYEVTVTYYLTICRRNALLRKIVRIKNFFVKVFHNSCYFF